MAKIIAPMCSVRPAVQRPRCRQGRDRRPVVVRPSGGERPAVSAMPSTGELHPASRSPTGARGCSPFAWVERPLVRRRPAHRSSGSAMRSAREVTASLLNTLRRWKSTMRGDTNSCAAASRLDTPRRTSTPTWRSCAVSSVAVETSRRADSPEARSSGRPDRPTVWRRRRRTAPARCAGGCGRRPGAAFGAGIRRRPGAYGSVGLPPRPTCRRVNRGIPRTEPHWARRPGDTCWAIFTGGADSKGVEPRCSCLLAVLRHDGRGQLFAGARAPSTLGTGGGASCAVCQKGAVEIELLVRTGIRKNEMLLCLPALLQAAGWNLSTTTTAWCRAMRAARACRSTRG